MPDVAAWLDQLLQPPSDLPETRLLHRLSDEDRTRLLGATDRVLNELPRQLQTAQKRLERHIRRLHEVEKALEKSLPMMFSSRYSSASATSTVTWAPPKLRLNGRRMR